MAVQIITQPKIRLGSKQLPNGKIVYTMLCMNDRGQLFPVELTEGEARVLALELRILMQRAERGNFTEAGQ